ncbi:hypothetical protein [Streptomyces sp. S063]|uniref:hypothetical protein n=1 Tax=Streptomyces sp. S063 TaxID=2005885 RepID=UPI001F2B7D5E|nr:hypothetical protein [Streptomyces sp. S063]
MVEAVRVLLLLMVGAGIWAAWRRSLFPGTWAHTFHTAYAEERALLTQARSELRAVDKDQRRAYSEADAKVGSVRGEYEQRVGKLKREVALLEDPGRGTERGRLGGLVLYEHAVLIFPEGRQLPLAGLQARVVSGICGCTSTRPTTAPNWCGFLTAGTRQQPRTRLSRSSTKDR